MLAPTANARRELSLAPLHFKLHNTHRQKLFSPPTDSCPEYSIIINGDSILGAHAHRLICQRRLGNRDGVCPCHSANWP